MLQYPFSGGTMACLWILTRGFSKHLLFKSFGMKRSISALSGLEMQGLFEGQLGWSIVASDVSY